MTEAADIQRLRESIATALRDGVMPPDLGGFASDALISAADWEGVLPLLEWRLRNGTGWDVLPEAFRRALAVQARAAAAHALFRESELRGISNALVEGGFQALLLKGPAFARLLYPEPYLRVSGDIDLLFATRSESDRAAVALSPLGYELAFVPGSATYEMTSRSTAVGVHRPELDLHCRLVNLPAYANAFCFDELWAAAIPLPGLNGLFGLQPVHALAHACIHRAVDLCLHRPDRLKWLYDIHLMLARMDDAAWVDFITMARAKKTCGVCLRSINDTIALFATPVPGAASDELTRCADLEPLDWRRLDDWRYMQWQNLKALPTWRARAVWLWERLLPTRNHLQELHGQDAGMAGLLWRRIKRGFVRVMNRG